MDASAERRLSQEAQLEGHDEQEGERQHEFAHGPPQPQGLRQVVHQQLVVCALALVLRHAAGRAADVGGARASKLRYLIKFFLVPCDFRPCDKIRLKNQ